MNLIIDLFGKPNPKNFYRQKLEWTTDFVEKNICNIEKNYSLYPYRNKWNCNVHSIHDYENDVFSIDYKFLRKEYEKIVVKVTQKFGIKKYQLSDIWYNYYKKGQYQEPHNHLGKYNEITTKGFTAVHYLIFDPKYHSPTKFTDRKLKSLDVEVGDIIFFSNDVGHYVPKNTSNKPRLTTAFTVTSF